MSQWTDAERFLLDRVKARDADAWSQLVARYDGRLLAFARARGVGRADAEDLVQDTFLHLLRGLDAFRGEASLETYLFLLLRRRIVEWFRTRRSHAALSPEAIAATSAQTASTYARHAEQLDLDRSALAAGIIHLVEDLRRELNFRDLQLAEMLFFVQRRNNDIAAALGLDENYIALRKHRWIKQLHSHIAPAMAAADSTATASSAESLLSEVWEDYRPSCPKRSTLGGYVLGTLDRPWHDYIEFHVNALGCAFCKANLDDLRRELTEENDRLRHRVFESSVGFFRPA